MLVLNHLILVVNTYFHRMEDLYTLLCTQAMVAYQSGNYSASVLAPQMLLLPLTHLSYKHPDFSCHSIQIFLLLFFSPHPLGASHPCSPGGGEEGSLNIFGFSSLLFDASSLGALATLLFLQGSRPLSPPPEWMHYQMHSLLECVTLSLHNPTSQ